MEGSADLKLFNSSFDGDLEGVTSALSAGGRVNHRNRQGATPLIAAAQKGHSDICRLLLAHGGNVNERHPGTNFTPLHFATFKGQEASVEVLLSWGAEVDAQDHAGGTPLYAACQEGHLASALRLLKAGATVTLPNNYGSLPIHIAAANNRVEIVRTLLEHGCSPDMVSYTYITKHWFHKFSFQLDHQTGETPLITAAKKGI